MAYQKKWEKKEERDYQQELTDKFIARIEEALSDIDKGLSWERPFFKTNEWPKNLLTGEKYRGGNIVALLCEDQYPVQQWATMVQINELSKKLDKPLQVEKGTSASWIMKVVPSYQKNENGEVMKREDGTPLPILNEDGSPKIGFKWFPVFNASCIKGLDLEKDLGLKLNPEVKPFETVNMVSQALQERNGLKVEHSHKTKAYYSPSQHLIHMPEPQYFVSSEAYADTFLHEASHSSARGLGRDVSGKFGEKNYAFEELIAELSSSFLSVELGIPHNPSSHENQAAYLKSWLGALQDDKTLITKASSSASKATEFIMGHYNAFKEELTQRENLAKELTQQLVPKQVKTEKLTMSM